MNKLPLATRVQILSMLCQGSSMRLISRLADVSINTVSKLLIDAGKGCAAFHDATVQNVETRRCHVDEFGRLPTRSKRTFGLRSGKTWPTATRGRGRQSTRSRS